MYASYEVELPRMDSAGSVKRAVYKDILDQLERDAVGSAKQLMSPDAATPTATATAWQVKCSDSSDCVRNIKYGSREAA